MPSLLVFNTESVRPWSTQVIDTQQVFQFSPPLVAPPRLPHGLRRLDSGRNTNIRIKSTTHNCTKDWVNCHITTWGDGSFVHSAIDDVFVLPPANMQYLTGEHMRKLNDPASVRVNFERPFITPPKVVVFLNHFDLDKDHNWRLNTSATEIGVDGFTLNIETRGDTILYGAQACWIAYPEDEPHIFSTSVNTMDVRPWDQPHLHQKTSKEITFDNVRFWKNPSIFVALNSFDIHRNDYFRIHAYVDDVSRTSLVWHIDTWADSVIYSAGVSIIAFIG